MMTNENIWGIALQQSAYDSGCEPVRMYCLSTAGKVLPPH
jgi:hypothetical protein